MFTREKSGVENGKYTGGLLSLERQPNNNDNVYVSRLCTLPLTFNKCTSVPGRVINT